MIEKRKHQSQHPWITAAKLRGLGGAARLLIDVLEPVGPIAAQLLWVAQPFAGALGARQAIHELAEMLDAPDGIEMLREQLQDDCQEE